MPSDPTELARRQIAELEDERGLVDAMRHFGEQAEIAEQLRSEVVARMRVVGMSWHAVGLAAGMTPEGARRRWSAASRPPGGST